MVTHAHTATGRKSVIGAAPPALEGAAAAAKGDEEEEDDDEMTEEMEAELEAKSRAARAKMDKEGHGTTKGRRKSATLYVSKAAFVCEHVEGDPTDLYDLGEKVSEGTFGYVRKAVHKLTHVPRAVKTVPKVLLEDS